MQIKLQLHKCLGRWSDPSRSNHNKHCSVQMSVSLRAPASSCLSVSLHFTLYVWWKGHLLRRIRALYGWSLHHGAATQTISKHECTPPPPDLLLYLSLCMRRWSSSPLIRVPLVKCATYTVSASIKHSHKSEILSTTWKKERKKAA